MIAGLIRLLKIERGVQLSDLVIKPQKQGIMDMVALGGAEHASAALSKWLGRSVQINTSGFKTVPLDELCSVMCPAEEVIIAVHTHISGALGGHVLLAFPGHVAGQLVDCLMGQPEGTTVAYGEMEQSALLETGNIVSSAFINSLATALGVRLLPTVPTFLFDLAGSIIEQLVLEQAAVSNSALMIAATFEIDSSSLDSWFFVMPDPKTLEVMEALLT